MIKESQPKSTPPAILGMLQTAALPQSQLCSCAVGATVQDILRTIEAEAGFQKQLLAL